MINFKNRLKIFIIHFKKFKGKLIKILVSFLLIQSLTFNSAQGAPLPGADAFTPVTYICRRRETYSREATGFRTHLQQNPTNGNIPRKNNKAIYDRSIPEFGCILEDSQIQAKFKHAKKFGVIGNPNRENFELFKDKMIEHMKDPSTKMIHGTYRKNIEVTNYLNPDTGLNVMINATDNKFLSGWELYPNQLKALQDKGDFF